jgi:cation diffusion facilitator family transporter
MAADTDRRRFRRASWANAVGNAVKIIVEGAAGLTFGSVALVADAAHSVADLIASFVVILWGGSRFDAPDREHPHGHARIEPLTALFVGAVIIILGLNLLYESVTGLLQGSTVTFSPILIGALAFAMVDMYLVYWYTRRMNKGIDAPALRALAADCLNDLYTTVAAIVGVLGVAAGYPILDPLAGALVSGLVVYQGVDIARENLSYLSGKAPPDERREEVRETLLSYPAVRGVHDLAVFYDGSVIEVEAHIETDGNLTLREAHDLETELLRAVRDLEDIEDVHLHLDPSGIGEWKDNNVGDADRT